MQILGESGVVAVDTNVVVRILIRDNPEQTRLTEKLFAAQEIYIPTTVLLEAEWVLRSAYGVPPKEIGQGLRSILGLDNVHIDNTGKIQEALEWFDQGLDFADAIHLASSLEREKLATFDIAFIKKANKLIDFPVGKP